MYLPPAKKGAMAMSNFAFDKSDCLTMLECLLDNA